MIVQVLAQSIGISQTSIEELMGLSLTDLYDHPTYHTLVRDLDFQLLQETLPQAREIYGVVLPSVIQSMSSDYVYAGRGLTAFTLGNWLVGFLSQPKELYRLIDIHKRVPTAAMEIGLPLILEGLARMEVGGTEWVKAMAILSLPFFAAE